MKILLKGPTSFSFDIQFYNYDHMYIGNNLSDTLNDFHEKFKIEDKNMLHLVVCG